MEIVKDIPKLYTALAEWLSCLAVVLVYHKFIEKKNIAVVCVKMIISLCLLCAIQTLCGMVSNGLWLVGMLAAILVMIVTVKTCIGLGWDAAFYGCARAFMRAEMMAAFEWQIYYYYFERSGKGNSALSIVFCLIVYTAVFVMLFYLESRQLPENLDKVQLAVSNKQVFVVWVTALFMFAISNLSYVEVESPFTGSGFEIFNIRTLIDLAGLLMLEAFHMQKADADRKQEMSAVQNILRTQYAQFRESQENINLINRKYHDLKHQLQVLREESNDEKRAAYLDEIEQGIRQYEAENKTGNTVLDTILTSKSSQCLKQGINFNVVADGTLLNHIHVMDLCTIFGNAIDNAIEYEVQVEDPEKRMIHVSVSGKKQLVCIIVENYYEGKLELDGSLPKTTKHDKRNHGYGLKSIQYSIKKYEGYVNVGIKDDWFRLEMILPKEVSYGRSQN